MAGRPDPDPAHRRRRLIITLSAIGVVLALFTGVGVYGLIIGTPAAPGPRVETGRPGQVADTPGTQATLPPLPRTTDPGRFATAVARALFTWDTFTASTPQEHEETLLEAADPTGLEVPGLVSDLGGYLPSQATWTQLQAYRTRQWLQIDRVFVPEQWHQAQAASGSTLPKGTVAYTIEGVRHRAGIWAGKPVTSAHPVSFTLFLACPPAADRCVLLRLSILDKPLH